MSPSGGDYRQLRRGSDRGFSEDEYKIDPDNLLRFLKQRRSIRQFQDRKIENELLDKILEAGRYAPTARNLQEISFAVIQDEMEEFHQLIWDAFENMIRENIKSGIDLSNSERHLTNIERYRENPTAENDVFTFNAPAVIVVLGDTSVGINDSIISYDAGLAAANMEHMINALGLGAFHCGMLNLTTDDEKVKNFIGIKENQKVVLSLVLGYPSKSLKYLRTVPRYKKPVIRK